MGMVGQERPRGGRIFLIDAFHYTNYDSRIMNPYFTCANNLKVPVSTPGVNPATTEAV
jgi:hypothetical protein